MKAQHFKTLPLALAVLVASGTAFAQAGQPNTGAHPTFGNPGNASHAVTINTQTGVVTNADGSVTTLVPGQTVFVLPSGGTAVGAGTSISGVIVPADSTAVRAILGAFAGSGANLTALEQGLINRSSITLTSAFGNATFSSPVPAMTQAEVTQALLLATSQLTSVGVSQPTPQQIQAALLGGTVTGSTGQSVALTGVLQLRRQGLNFVQIAQTLGTQAALGFQGGTTTTPPPVAARDRDTTRPGVAGSAPVRQDGGFRSSAINSSTAATTPATGTSSSAPPAGSASASRGNPAATGGAGLR